MKKHRGWIILALIVALAAAGIWLIGKVIAVYPGLGDPVSYPVNQVDGVTLTIEAPSFSPFQGYTIAWKVTADSDDVYHFTCDGEAPNTFEFLERKVDGQWYRLAYTQNDFPYSTVEFALGGEESAALAGRIVQKYAYYGTRLEAGTGTYRVVLETQASDGTPRYLAREFEVS